METLLDVRGLSVSFFAEGSVTPALRDVTFCLKQGEILGLAGESGSGKSMTALSILRLIPYPGRITLGSIHFMGRNILQLPEREMRRLRGNQIGMIFQEPISSLNPLMRVGNQVAETLILHRGLSPKDARKEAVRLLRAVRIPSPEAKAREYPHQLSGGMRQRTMIAMAIACRPSLLIADEPTTALDAIIQAEVLELLHTLRSDYGIAILMISHSLSVLLQVADRIIIMYAGRIVEQSTSDQILSSPAHPYTVGLLRSIPRISPPGMRKTRLETIDGSIPHLANLPSGCSFYPRCPERMDLCLSEFPSVRSIDPEHRVSCYLYHETS